MADGSHLPFEENVAFTRDAVAIAQQYGVAVEGEVGQLPGEADADAPVAAGAPTDVAEAGLTRACPRCGTHHHPRTDPVVIMLVEDGDRLLLGRSPAWPPRRYSALAGFVEPGENLEEAVAREVLEESGVRVGGPRYLASQPWPFPSSLMVGFIAPWESGEPAPGEEDIDDVRWFDREEVAAAAADDAGGWGGDSDAPLLLPPRLAIARRLIERWLAG
jgi:NAD+ diphosphatase